MARGPGGQTSPATSGTFAGIYVRRIVIGLASRCTDVTSSLQRLVRTPKVLGGALQSSQIDLRPTYLASRLAMWQPSCNLTRLATVVSSGHAKRAHHWRRPPGRDRRRLRIDPRSRWLGCRHQLLAARMTRRLYGAGIPGRQQP